MRRAVISDLHLTSKFEPSLYDHLSQILLDNDEVVINGDLWDGYLISFDGFLNSKWAGLFPLMKEKVVYLYGNHDIPKWQDERNSRFSKKVTDLYYIDLPNGLRLRVQHGHSLYKYRGVTIEKYLPLRTIGLIPYLALIKIEKALSDKFGWEKSKHIWWEDRTRENADLSKVADKILQKGEILVAGHIHLPLFTPEKGYINTGAIMHGMSSYLQIDDEQLKMVYSRY